MKKLFVDIENAPSLGWFYDLWKEGNIVGTKAEQYFLCVAYKWEGGRMQSFALPDFKGYKAGSENDKLLIVQLWKLFDEADIIVAHNGDRFDIRKTNARFAFWGLPPPSPYKTVDTLKVARRYFYFTSNKLDSLGKHLGYGSKLVHTGFDLWKRCMEGDLEAWKVMVRYNKRDVVLLEKIYKHFLPYITNHPNVSVMKGRQGCPNCGNTKLMRQGTDYTAMGRVQQYKCMKCLKWCRGKYEKVTNIR